MHRLPYDVQLAVLRLLGTRDIVRLCATCKALQALMSDRSLWHAAFARLLVHFPQPQLTRRLADMTVEELKFRVLHSARLDHMWHGIDYKPRLVRNFHCNNTVEHVNLVAGGEWLVVVLYDGSLQLHELGAPTPAVTLSHSLTEDESVFYLSSRLSLTDEHEDLVILQMGVRYNQCNIYVYHVSVFDPSPAFLLMGKVSVTGSVWCCASGGRLLVYGLENGVGEMILHVCHILSLPTDAGPDAHTDGVPPSAHTPRPQVSMNIGPWSADEDFTISVLSETQLLIAHQGGLSIYEIPQASSSDLPSALAGAGAGGATDSAGTVEPETRVHSVRPVWSCRCDIGSGIYRVSPFSWGPRTSTSKSGRFAPLVIAGTHALHVLRVLPVPTPTPTPDPTPDPDDGPNPGTGLTTTRVEHREIPYPLALGPEVAHMGLGAVGVRRAIWDCTEARNGSLHVHFRTYSLPRSVLGLGADDPAFDTGDEGELGAGAQGRGRLGSFSVTLDREEHLVSLCLEESSGRVCLLLNNVMTGARRISVIDVV